MIRRLPWVLFGLSAVFNFTFAGGLLTAEPEPDESDGQAAVEQVAEELGLDETQQERFAKLRDESREAVEKLSQAIALARQEVYDEVHGDSPDDERIAELETELAELHAKMQRVRMDHFHRFLDTLSPEQRHKIIGRMRGRKTFRRHWEPVLRRFDEDGDGDLNERERRKAHQRLMNHAPLSGDARGGAPEGPPPPGGRRPHPPTQGGRRGERPRGVDDSPEVFRAAVLKRFDVNGDGTLDPAERQAALRATRARMQWLEEQLETPE